MKFASGNTDRAVALVQQRTFRRLLSAFAYPGVVVTLEPSHDCARDQARAGLALLDALVDHSTPIWIDDSLVATASTLRHWPKTDRANAIFALCRSGALCDLKQFASGTPVDPHLSTTLVVEIEHLTGGKTLDLAGPGIPPSGRTISPQGLPPEFCREWAVNNASFPLGVDLILTAGLSFLCLPRSVQLESADVCAS